MEIPGLNPGQNKTLMFFVLVLFYFSVTVLLVEHLNNLFHMFHFLDNGMHIYIVCFDLWKILRSLKTTKRHTSRFLPNFEPASKHCKSHI